MIAGGIALDFFGKDVYQKKSEFVATDGYKKRTSVMNSSETAFFFELEKQLPQGYHIFPKMRIADLIDATDGYGLRYRKNKILPKHIDFAICDSYFKPIMAIELNGSSHNRADRIERDQLVNEIFRVASLPLKTVGVGTSFQEETKEIISFLLKN